MKEKNNVKTRLDLIPNLEEDISMAQSGGDVKVNPIVLAVVELIVVTGT